MPKETRFEEVVGYGDAVLTEPMSTPYSTRTDFEQWPKMMEDQRTQLIHAVREFAKVLYHLGVGSGTVRFTDNRETPEMRDPSLDPMGRPMMIPDTFLVREGQYISSVELIEALRPK